MKTFGEWAGEQRLDEMQWLKNMAGKAMGALGMKPAAGGSDPKAMLTSLYSNLDFCIQREVLDPQWGEKLKAHVKLIQQALG